MNGKEGNWTVIRKAGSLPLGIGTINPKSLRQKVQRQQLYTLTSGPDKIIYNYCLALIFINQHSMIIYKISYTSSSVQRYSLGHLSEDMEN